MLDGYFLETRDSELDKGESVRIYNPILQTVLLTDEGGGSGI